MFEVRTRWKKRARTLFIFDDIADSFDYKNKFAIVDYLEEIVKDEGVDFLAIILTHNFDFLRTIDSRNICPTHQCYMAFKKDGRIALTSFKRSDLRNPFDKWKSRLAEPVIQIAYIPFLRNVVEYTKGTKDDEGNVNEDYLALTHMLHYKDDTENLKIENYQAVFERNFPILEFPNIDPNLGILEHMFTTADECLGADDGINLEQKIVLSMAIRIWTERYIIGKIRSNDADYDTDKKQTGNLVQDYKDLFNNESEKITLMKRINLITPSNIHINAFMYEPILDMGFDELKGLYESVKVVLV